MWGRDEGRSAVSEKLDAICAEATGAVWEEWMRLASAVQLGQLLSRGSLKLVSAERSVWIAPAQTDGQSAAAGEDADFSRTAQWTLAAAGGKKRKFIQQLKSNF